MGWDRGNYILRSNLLPTLGEVQLAEPPSLRRLRAVPADGAPLSPAEPKTKLLLEERRFIGRWSGDQTKMILFHLSGGQKHLKERPYAVASCLLDVSLRDIRRIGAPTLLILGDEPVCKSNQTLLVMDTRHEKLPEQVKDERESTDLSVTASLFKLASLLLRLLGVNMLDAFHV